MDDERGYFRFHLWLLVVPSHVFVDESKVRGLLVAAVVSSATDVNVHRRAMASLLMPRQRRLHFTKESAARQRQILGVIDTLDLTFRLYQAARNDAAGRQACLFAVVEDAADHAERLVVERDETTLDFDRRVLYSAARKHGCTETLQYELLAPHLDPMLWIPDAVAWAWTKGGEWRRRVSARSIVRKV